MDVHELQERLARRYGEGDERLGLQALATVLAEEVGELATAARSGDRDGVAEEAADVAFLAFCLAELAGADLGARIRGKYLEGDVDEVASDWEGSARAAHGVDEEPSEGGEGGSRP